MASSWDNLNNQLNNTLNTLNEAYNNLSKATAEYTKDLPSEALKEIS